MAHGGGWKATIRTALARAAKFRQLTKGAVNETEEMLKTLAGAGMKVTKLEEEVPEPYQCAFLWKGLGDNQRFWSAQVVRACQRRGKNSLRERITLRSLHEGLPKLFQANAALGEAKGMMCQDDKEKPTRTEETRSAGKLRNPCQRQKQLGSSRNAGSS